MANTIITKNSATASAVPTSGDLVQGELAVNVTDKRLFTEDSGGTVVEVGTNPSSLTLTSGTANGVTYLNGSKVLTTGSALTFDGTNLGVGTSSPSAPLMVLKGAAGADVAYLLNASGYGLRFQAQTGGSGTNSMLYVASGETLSFGVNNAEQMRLTSTGLGIGTSSPAAKLDVSGGSIRVNEDGAGTKVLTIRSDWAGVDPAINVTTNNNLLFMTNNTERMRMTSTGLGIGTSSPAYKLDVYLAAGGTAANVASNANNIRYAVTDGTITARLGVDTGNCGYVGTQSNDAFKIRTNGTDIATFSAAGNLGLGVTPSAWASYFSAVQAGNASKGGAFVSAGGFSVYGSNYYEDVSGVSRYVNSTYALKYATLGNGTHAWYTAPSGTAGAAISFTQAMTLDASGNLGVGATSPAARVHAMSSSSSLSFGLSPSNSNTNIGYITNDSTYIMFASGYGSTGQKFRVALQAPDNAATIDSSGNLLVGTTTPGEGISYGASGITTIKGTYGAMIKSTGGASYEVLSLWNEATSGTIYQIFFRDGASGSVRGSVTTNASSTSYNTSSDYRLKEDWQPMTGASERVKALKPVNFAWKVDGSRVDGFLAHEAQAVVPEAVTGEKDAVDADGNPEYQGIDQSKLVPLLTAALQEALAQIESLTARVSALEGN